MVQSDNKNDSIEHVTPETPTTTFNTPPANTLPKEGVAVHQVIEMTNEARQDPVTEDVKIYVQAETNNEQSKTEDSQNGVKITTKSKGPITFYCTTCKDTQISDVEFQQDKCARILLIFVYILLLPLICCFLILGPPFQTQVVIHKCPQCKKEIGRAGPFG